MARPDYLHVFLRRPGKSEDDIKIYRRPYDRIVREEIGKAGKMIDRTWNVVDRYEMPHEPCKDWTRLG